MLQFSEKTSGSIWYIFLFSVAGYFFSLPWPDPDIWGLMATGRFIIENRTIPLQDPFSYTETVSPWIYHEWLSGVTFYWLYNRLTPASIYILKTFIGLIIFMIIIKRSKRPSLINTLFWGLVFFELAKGLGPRPQIFTYLFFTITIVICEGIERSSTPGALELRPGFKNRLLLYSLIPIMILWANLHGGFVAGIGIIILYSIGGRHRYPFLIVAILSIIATIINPYKTLYWKYLWYAITLKRPNIDEWNHLTLDLSSMIQFKVLLLISLLWILFNLRCFKPVELLCLIVTAYLSISHVRHTPFFAITAGLFIPKVKWEAVTEKMELQGPLRNRVPIIFLAVALWSLFIIPSNYIYLNEENNIKMRWQDTLDEEGFPLDAARFIKNNRIKGNLAVSFEWGEYCIWKLYPEIKVSFDPRYETVYTDKTISEYWDFHSGNTGWDRHLRNADYALVSKILPSYNLMVSDKKKWDMIFEDRISALFKRADTPES